MDYNHVQRRPKLFSQSYGWLCPRCFRKLVAVPQAERAIAQAVARRLAGTPDRTWESWKAEFRSGEGWHNEY